MALEMGDPQGGIMGAYGSQKSIDFPGEYEVVNCHHIGNDELYYVERHLTANRARYLAYKLNGGRKGSRQRQANFNAWFVSDFLPSLQQR